MSETPSAPNVDRTAIVAAGASKPAGPYSHAIRSGDLLFISGQGPFDDQGVLVGDTFAEHVRSAFDLSGGLRQLPGIQLDHARVLATSLPCTHDHPCAHTRHPHRARRSDRDATSDHVLIRVAAVRRSMTKTTTPEVNAMTAPRLKAAV